MEIDNWVITAGISALIISAFKTPKLYKEYLYEKVFFISMSAMVIASAYQLGLYFSISSIPENFSDKQKELMLSGISKFEIPYKWLFSLLAVMIGNFVLESISSAVIKHEKDS